MMAACRMPVIASGLDSYIIASRIHSMTVKTLPGDTEKIERIQNLVSEHVNIPGFWRKSASATKGPSHSGCRSIDTGMPDASNSVYEISAAARRRKSPNTSSEKS